jgi:hypothetical protein
MILPRYPIYIPSKNRSHIDMTTACLRKDGVPFRLVVEPQEEEVYGAKFGRENILVLPENNRGLIYSRNWMFEHAKSEGHARHWQVDDNITGIWRWYKGFRLYCEAGVAFAVTEDFSDRYENVAIAGLNYVMFAIEARKPIAINCHVYSCTLIDNSIPFRFRPPANEDVDMCLQVLSAGYCTIQMNAFLAQKLGTMIVSGGQTDAAYKGDGRLFMARALERAWPGVVETKRRFQRPQHVIKFAWRKFDNKLKLKPGVDLAKIPPVNEYGLRLIAKTEVRSTRLKRLLKQNQAEIAAIDPTALTKPSRKPGRKPKSARRSPPAASPCPPKPSRPMSGRSRKAAQPQPSQSL